MKRNLVGELEKELHYKKCECDRLKVWLSKNSESGEFSPTYLKLMDDQLLSMEVTNSILEDRISIIKDDKQYS